MKLEIMTINQNALANKRAMTAVNKIVTAINLSETSELVKAVQLYNLRSYIKSGEITEYTNIETLAKELFDINRAQTFNYLKIAEWIVIKYAVQECEETADFPEIITSADYDKLSAKQKKFVKEIYTDRLTQSIDHPLSPTALLAIVRFIKLNRDGSMDDTARARYNFVLESCRKGDITGTMSVSAISTFLNGYNKPKQTNATDKPNDKTTDKTADKTADKTTDKTADKTTDKPNDDTPQEPMLSIELNAKQCIALQKALKDVDIIHEYPELIEFIGTVGHWLVTPKSKL